MKKQPNLHLPLRIAKDLRLRVGTRMTIPITPAITTLGTLTKTLLPPIPHSTPSGKRMNWLKLSNATKAYLKDGMETQAYDTEDMLCTILKTFGMII